MDLQHNSSKQTGLKSVQQLGVIPQDGFMRINVVLSVIGESRTGWFDGIRRGDYPPQIKLAGGRSSAWLADDIRKIIELIKVGKTWHDRELS